MKARNFDNCSNIFPRQNELRNSVGCVKVVVVLILFVRSQGVAVVVNTNFYNVLPHGECHLAAKSLCALCFRNGTALDF